MCRGIAVISTLLLSTPNIISVRAILENAINYLVKELIKKKNNNNKKVYQN